MDYGDAKLTIIAATYSGEKDGHPSVKCHADPGAYLWRNFQSLNRNVICRLSGTNKFLKFMG